MMCLFCGCVVAGMNMPIGMRTGYMMLSCLVVMSNMYSRCGAVFLGDLLRRFIHTFLLGLLRLTFLLTLFKFRGFLLFMGRRVTHNALAHLVCLVMLLV